MYEGTSFIANVYRPVSPRHGQQASCISENGLRRPPLVIPAASGLSSGMKWLRIGRGRTASASGIGIWLAHLFSNLRGLHGKWL